MTINSATNKVIYTANGVLTDFDFTFKTFRTSDIQVYLDDVLQGSGYSVTLNSDQETSPGGTVIFDVAPADQTNITIVREVPLSQNVDYQAYDPFPANTHEAALDKLTMQNQQQQEELDRTTKASITDDGTTDYTLPLYDAGKAIIWDDPTKQLVNSDDEINGITAAAQQSADDSAASAAASSADAADADNTLKDFETKYLGAKTSDPALDNEGNALIDGALYYNTTNNVMRVYDLGTNSWADVGSSTAQIYQYSSTSAGQTVVTGADDNANVLSYVAGFIQVFYNGQLLSDTDYTETSSSVITLADGVEVAGDQITILAFGTFDVANTYTQAQSDANYAPKATNTGEVATTSGTAVTWSSIPAWVTKISILVDQVSFAGTDHMRIQLGIASGTVTTGYVTDSVIMTHNATSDWVTRTDGFVVYIGDASRTVQGVIELHKGVGDHWFNTATVGLPVSEQGAITGGICDIGGDLTDVIINGDNGSAFDNGSVTLIYE